MSRNEDTPSPRVIPPSRRRDKPIVSCSLCRRRKLKCDRQHPCSTCVHRGLSLSCTYVRPNARDTPKPRSEDSVHERIAQLEQLVTTLIDGKEHPSLRSADSVSSGWQQDVSTDEDRVTVSGADRVKVTRDATSYTNSSHWTSILDGISELKNHLDLIPPAAASQANDQGAVQGPELLFGLRKHATREELLVALPSRQDADQLLAMYFASTDTALAVVHKAKFMQEYERFWQAPFETPTMWIALFYGMLALGSQFQSRSQDFDSPFKSLASARVELYRGKLVQAIFLANYTNCPAHTIETMVLYFGTEYLRYSDSQFSMWIVTGIIVRLSLRMGYHRDPSRFPNISPFDGEMRRRLWLIVLSLDLVSSAQVGLPRMLQTSMWDTHEPRNLLDDDLSEDMSELPPSRPETELNQLLYTIVATRIRNILAKVLDLMNGTAQPQHRELMELDVQLRKIYDNAPDVVKNIAMIDFDARNSPSSIRPLYLALLFLKAKLMLHWPYLILGRSDPKYENSRRICLNAAHEMLVFQAKIHQKLATSGQQMAPGWQVFTMSWYISCIVAQDFLLATAVLTIDLEKELMEPHQTAPRTEGTGLWLDQDPPSRSELVEALRNAHCIWSQASRKSQEARKMAEAVNLVLQKAAMQGLHTQHSVAGTPQELTDYTFPMVFNDGLTSAPWGLDMFDMPNNSANMDAMNAFSMGYSALPQMFNWSELPNDLRNFPQNDSQMPPFG